MFRRLFYALRRWNHRRQMRTAIRRSEIDSAVLSQFQLLGRGNKAWEFLQIARRPRELRRLRNFEDMIVHLVGSIAATYSVDKNLQNMFDSLVPPPTAVVARLQELGFKPFDAMPDPTSAAPAVATQRIGLFMKNPYDSALFQGLPARPFPSTAPSAPSQPDMAS